MEVEPENTAEKAFQQLQTDYYKLCAQAGETAYVVSTKRNELKNLYGQMRRLNKKAAKWMEEKKKEKTPLKAVETPAMNVVNTVKE